jgi:hypothetical protein
VVLILALLGIGALSPAQMRQNMPVAGHGLAGSVRLPTFQLTEKSGAA